MRINIVNKNSVLSDSLEGRLEKKIAKLEKFFEENQECTVRLSQERGNRNIVEITIHLDGTVLRAEEASADMYVSLDKAVDKLIRQIRRHRTKLEKRLRDDAFLPEADEAAPEEPVEEPGHLVRVKRFTMKPMTVADAIAQMELLGHSFYLFINEETNASCVVYRRNDGNIGLLEPENG